MLAEKYKQVLPALTMFKYQPCVSVILPFEPKMYSKEAIAVSLKNAAEKIKPELFNNYAKKIAENVLAKLYNVFSALDYSTHKKSIAIYVSPAIEKVYYLDIAVEERIKVDSSFEIRDLVMDKKDEEEFLLLAISEKQEKIFLSKEGKLTRIISNSSINVNKGLAKQVVDFTNAEAIKQNHFTNFLCYIDNGLSLILKSYPFPIFVMGAEKTTGNFKAITKHADHIAGFIQGNFDNSTDNELKKALQKVFTSWKAIKTKYIINQLEAAQKALRLAMGIHDVWVQANSKQQQLLVVEKDFYCPAFVTEKGETIFSNTAHDNVAVAKDAVDIIIEKVLQNGGNVEFVDELKDYHHIGLIRL